jgi:hypothetical protein
VIGFHQYITELFEKPWKQMYTTTVLGASGLPIVSYVYSDPEKPGERDALVVVFQQLSKDSDTWELLFHRGGEFTSKGQGGASGVFASVLDAAQLFLKKHDPLVIRFTASKSKSDSKARAYNALVKRFVSKFGYKLEDARQAHVPYAARQGTMEWIWWLKKT